MLYPQEKLPLILAIFTMSFSTILLFAVFLVARSSYRGRFSSYWLIGWSFYALRSCFEMIDELAPGLAFVYAGNLISLCGSSIFLLVAATRLKRDEPAARLPTVAVACSAAAIVGALLLGADRRAMVFSVFAACGLIQMATSVPFFRFQSSIRTSSPRLAAMALLLLGALNMTYYWARPDRVLAPAAFQLGALLRITLGIAVAVMLFESSRGEARRAAARYQVLFNSLSDAVFIVDLTEGRLGKFIEVNDQAAKLLGYSKEELLTMGPADIEVSGALLREGAELANNYTPLLLHWVHESKSGERIPVDISVQAFELDGRPAALGIARDVRDREASEARLREALGEKEALLRELHHRVKNNLQVIISLLSLQAGSMSDPKAVEALTESKTRVASIAIVHELLYNDRGMTSVGLKSYVEELVRQIYLSRGQGRGVEVAVEGIDLQYGMERAVPVGLILAELVTNAYKYAFRGRAGGNIRISIDREGGSDRIRIADDGVGMGEGPSEAKTLGLSLVDILSKQLQGSVESCTSSAGTSWTLLVPSSDVRAPGTPQAL